MKVLQLGRSRRLGHALLLTCILITSKICSAGYVIAVGDEWPLTDGAFAALPTEATNLAQNIGGLMAPGQVGSFLVYTNESPNGALTGSSLASAMVNAGHSWTIDNTVPFNATALSVYDGILIAGTIGSGSTNAEVLAEYVQNGGSVLIEAGTGDFGSAAAEAAGWNPFLNKFGLAFGDTWFNNVPQSVPAEPGSHVLRSGVDNFWWGFGQTTFELNPANPLTDIAIIGDFSGTGLMPIIAVSAVPLPAAAWLFGSGLLVLIGMARGKKVA